MGRSRTSLVPSGREFDVETAYRLPFGDWATEGNLAYRIDPDDTRASQGFVALATLSRKF